MAIWYTVESRVKFFELAEPIKYAIIKRWRELSWDQFLKLKVYVSYIMDDDTMDNPIARANAGKIGLRYRVVGDDNEFFLDCMLKDGAEMEFR